MTDEETSSEDMEELRSKLAEAQEWRLNWQEFHAAAQRHASRLMSELEAERERSGKLERWCARQEEATARMGKELMETTRARDIFRDNLRVELERLRKLEALRAEQHEAAATRAKELREKLHDALRRAKKAEEESDFFQKQFEKLVATNGVLRNELTGTRVALKDVRTAHSEVVAGWQRTSEDNERLKREIHTMNRELSGWRTGAQRDAMDAEINLLRGRLDEAIAQNEVLRGELREKEAMVIRLRGRIEEPQWYVRSMESLAGEKYRLRKHLTEANAKRATYKREIRRLQAALLRQRGEWKSEKVEGLEMRVRTLEQKRRDQLSDELDTELEKLRTSAEET